MRSMSRWFLAAALAASPATAQDDAAALARASERGRIMYAYDRAAWLGTDDMLAKLRDPATKVAGYIVEGSAETPRLIFFDKGAEPQAVYIARLADGKLVEGKVLGATDDRAIAPTTRRMIAALATARQAIAASPDAGPCEKATFNTVVLPPETANGPVPVYFLTPQVNSDRIPFGGHFQIDVAADGKPSAIRRFTNTCLAMPTKPPAGGENTSVVVTQLIGDLPTEIHVFTSLAVRVPVMVITGKPVPRVWPVTGDRIGSPVDLKK